VLEPSLAREPDVLEGLGPNGLLLLNAESAPATPTAARIACVPATRLAAEAGSRFANVVMAGAVAAALGEPPLEDLQDAAVELLGAKAPEDAVRAAVAEGFAWPTS